MNRYILLFLFFSSLFGSCISQKYITIDVYEPAKISLPPEIAYISVVDNTLIYPENKQDLMIVDKNIKWVSLEDTKTVFKQSLVKYLNEEQFFAEVFDYPYEVRTDDSYGIESPMKFSQIRGICKEEGVDAIISIDDIQLSVGIAKYWFDYQGISLGMKVKLRTYSSDGNMLSEPIVLNDTLYMAQDIYDDGANTIPPINDILNEMTTLFAKTLLRQYAPYWETQDRMFFTGVKNADKLITANNWKEAIIVWEDEYNNKADLGERAKIAFNLALAYECTDQVAKSMDWIEKSASLTSSIASADVRKSILNYRKILEQRQLSLLKLENQIGDVGVEGNGDL